MEEEKNIENQNLSKEWLKFKQQESAMMQKLHYSKERQIQAQSFFNGAVDLVSAFISAGIIKSEEEAEKKLEVWRRKLAEQWFLWREEYTDSFFDNLRRSKLKPNENNGETNRGKI